MRYAIVYLLKGKARGYHIGLVSEISKKFQLRNLNDCVMPHVTLKSPFEGEDIKIVENLIEDYSRRMKKVGIELKGFSDFDKKVLFFDFVSSSDAFEIQKGLINILDFAGLDMGEFDRKWKPHSTLAYFDNDYKFEEVKRYLSGGNPNYKMFFDNISIIKKLKDKWVIHKEFELK